MRRLLRPELICLLLLAAPVLTAAAVAAPASPTPAALPVAVPLRAPLTTVVSVGPDLGIAMPARPRRLEVTIAVPDHAPADLGIGAWCSDQHGHWFQRLHPLPLRAGVHSLRFDLAAAESLQAEPQRALWSTAKWERIDRGGIFFWSASASTAPITIRSLRVLGEPVQSPRSSARVEAYALRDLQLPDLVDGRLQWRTGDRWELHCLPEPFPTGPYDADVFTLDLLVTDPAGVTRRYPGYFHEPIHLRDVGDAEAADYAGFGRFVVRFRPQQPGRHQLCLEARWGTDGSCTVPLPDAQATGPLWDDFVRVDPVDPRFFVTGLRAGRAELYWPIGLNIRSVWDVRSHTNKNFTTRLTPERGAHAYSNFLQRLRAAGGTAVEIWLASWNFALEWRGDWHGYYGLGDYNQANAQRLEEVLDLAYGLGMRINVVVRNHGMASGRSDRQWPDNPYNALIGGPAAQAVDFFRQAEALRLQRNYRRYLIGRYGDHPAVLGWKVFSEVNLTAARGEVLRNWFKITADSWHELDPYEHPVALHWSGDYRTPDRSVVALPEMDYICIDAYHGRRRRGGTGPSILADIIVDGMQHPTRSLGKFGKPLLATEYGGSARACPEQQLLAEHKSAAFAGLLSGNAGAPMLWWWEWVDQNGHWDSYTAISSFVAGEDLRNRPDSTARCARLASEQVDGDATTCVAWVRPGRLLGYCYDRRWAGAGLAPEAEPIPSELRIVVGDAVAAGRVAFQWWDADTGAAGPVGHIDHPGGRLELVHPAFTTHLAFKLWRPQPEISRAD